MGPVASTLEKLVPRKDGPQRCLLCVGPTVLCPRQPDCPWHPWLGRSQATPSPEASREARSSKPAGPSPAACSLATGLQWTRGAAQGPSAASPTIKRSFCSGLGEQPTPGMRAGAEGHLGQPCETQERPALPHAAAGIPAVPARVCTGPVTETHSEGKREVCEVSRGARRCSMEGTASPGGWGVAGLLPLPAHGVIAGSEASIRTLAQWHQGVTRHPPSHVEAPSASLTLRGCPPCTHFPHAAPPGGARLVRGVTITTPGTRLAGPALSGHGEPRAARGRQPGGRGPDPASWGGGRPPHPRDRGRAWFPSPHTRAPPY